MVTCSSWGQEQDRGNGKAAATDRAEAKAIGSCSRTRVHAGFARYWDTASGTARSWGEESMGHVTAVEGQDTVQTLSHTPYTDNACMIRHVRSNDTRHEGTARHTVMQTTPVKTMLMPEK